MARLRIRLSGPFEVTLDGQPVTEFESNSARALLAHLASEPGRPRVRATVAEMLWPERPQGAALANLRHALSSVRRALGGPDAGETFLVADRTTVALASDDVWVDLVALEELASAPANQPGAVEAWEQAAALWRGSLLEDVAVHAGAEWDEWLAVTDERARRLACGALHGLVASLEQTGNVEQALRHARRLAELDPWDERAHRAILRLLASTGDDTGAVAHFEDLRSRLREDLGTDPAPETVSLATRIREGEARFVVPRPAVTYPDFLATARPGGTGTPFVDQTMELEFLERHLAEAGAGAGRVVLVSGEAGSGKTMLATELMRRAAATDATLTTIGRSSAYGGLGDPYLPFRDVLGSLTGDVESDVGSGTIDVQAARRLWALAPHTARLVLERGPSLVGVMVNGALLVERVETAAPDVPWLEPLRLRVEIAAAQPPAPERMQPALFDEFMAVLDGIARIAPLLVVIDDLQWADAGSVALLWHLCRRLEGRRILVVGCYRPEEVLGTAAGGHPLQAVIDELRTMAADRVLELTPGRDFVDAYLDAEPNRLDEAFRERLQARTAGHPLFTTEMVRGMADRAEIRRGRDGLWIVGGSLDWQRLPTRVEAAIARRFRRLPDDTRRDLIIAAVQGEEFIAEVVARVRDDPEARTRLRLESTSGNLVIEPAGAMRVAGEIVERYRFRHILFQQFLDRELDDAERARLHETTGRTIEDLFAGHPDPPVVDLAHHFDEAGLVEPAIAYARAGGYRAVRMSANEEAIRLFGRALELLSELPESPARDTDELVLLAALMAPTMAVRGYTAPESEAGGRRIRQLADRLEPSPVMALALAGLAHYLTIRARHYEGLAISRDVGQLGEALDNAGIRCLAAYMTGYEELWMGRVDAGGRNLEAAVDLHDPERDTWLVPSLGMAVGPEAHAWGALAALYRGRPATAYRMADDGVALARRIGHPFSLCHALDIGGVVVRLMAGDHEAALRFADEAAAIAEEEHFPFWATGIALHRGMAIGHLGDPEAGIQLIEGSLSEWEDTGVDSFRGWALSQLASLEALRGQPERGLEIVDEELPHAMAVGEGLSELFLRLERGRLEQATGAIEAALTTLEDVAASAREAGAGFLELRAATALASLVTDLGRSEEADAVLGPVLATFDEGPDIPHVAAARAVLAGS